MKIEIDRQWRVRAMSVLRVPLPAASVWGQMRDFERFTALDPLHVRVRTERSAAGLPAASRLVISHRLCGIGPDRVGRILKWEEGRGYVFSDLSKRGVRRGFPHVCSYAVEPAGPGACTLAIGARGRWTATWVPRMVVRLWLWWVLRATESRISLELLRLRAWRQRRRA